MKEIRSLYNLRNKINSRRITRSLGSIFTDDYDDDTFRAVILAIKAMTRTHSDKSGQYAFMALGEWLKGEIDTKTFMKHLPQ